MRIVGETHGAKTQAKHSNLGFFFFLDNLNMNHVIINTNRINL